jgi:hypothetical protein
VKGSKGSPMHDEGATVLAAKLHVPDTPLAKSLCACQCLQQDVICEANAKGG